MCIERQTRPVSRGVFPFSVCRDCTPHVFECNGNKRGYTLRDEALLL